MSVKVYLVERTKRCKSGRVSIYYAVKWCGQKGTQQRSIGKAKKGGGDMTRAQAEEVRRQTEMDLHGGSMPLDRPREMKLSEFVQWHELAEGAAFMPKTHAEWRGSIKHAIEAWGDERLTKLNGAHVGLLRKRMHERGRSLGTIQKTLRSLGGMFNRAKRAGLLHVNPIAGHPIGPATKRAKRIFAPAEIEALVGAAPDVRWEAMIRLLFTSGLRKGEALHLRWEDVEIREEPDGTGRPALVGVVRVEQREAGRYVVGGGDVPILPWKPKTGSSIRAVPIPEQTAAALLRLRAASGGSPYPFIRLDRLRMADQGGRSRGYVQTNNLWPRINEEFDRIQAEAARATEAPNWKRGTLHDCRKTFATRCASAGVPMRELQAHLGHSSITMTAEFYTAVEASAAGRLRKVFAA